MQSKVAIVGRPNVGKSTLFNRLAGRRQAIVQNQPEITRDRIHNTVAWNGKNFTLIDTGGLVPEDENKIRKLVAEQTQYAIDEADLILFMVDGREGLNALDEDISLILKKTHKKVFVIVNKIDRFEEEGKIFEFYSMGFKDVFPLSAEHGLNTGDLLDLICENLKDIEAPQPKGITVAIVGCPNVGKSSLFNLLLGQQRTIVHDVPGTTRDSINTEIKIGEDTFVFIDTAGLREKRKVFENIEYYSNVRAIDSIQEADVVLLVIDAFIQTRAQDKKIAALIAQYGKASIIIANKWDLVEEQSTKDELKKYKSFFTEKMKEELGFINYSPILFTSTISKKGVYEIYRAIKDVYEQYCKTVETKKLSRLIENIMSVSPPVSVKGNILKIYYAHQSGAKPPTIIFRCNDHKLASPAYVRYLEKKLREEFGFAGAPLKMIMRKSK